jgi:hypothetical protein
MNSNVAAVASAQRAEFLDVQTAWLENLLDDGALTICWVA